MNTEKLKFPKIKKNKKRKIHKQSILQKKEDGTCYLCERLHNDHRIHKYREEHHIFGGNPNRKISEAEGLKVYLCPDHHRNGPEAPHNNIKINRLLQQDAQRAFESSNTRNDFMKLFGRNYLEEGGENEKANSIYAGSLPENWKSH